jgi:transposase InsO family protein
MDGPTMNETMFCAALCAPMNLRSSNKSTEEPKESSDETFQLSTQWPAEEIRAEQLADPDIGPIFRAVEAGHLRPAWEAVSPETDGTRVIWNMWDRLTVKNGLLYRRFEDSISNQHRLQLIVPHTRKLLLLHMAHDMPLGGHLGSAKTMHKLQDFYWVNMRHDIEDYCRRCDECTARKPRTKNRRAPMKPYTVCGPMLRVCTDILGPFTRSSSGNRYVLVITDSFTKFTEAFPMKDIEARTVARIIVREWICRYGVMEILHSDQGIQFESHLMRELCQMLGIKKTRTTAWRPKANGQAERYMRTLTAMISIYTNGEEKLWDRHLPFIMAAYRCARHESTGLTPNLMIFGRENKLPWHLVVGHPDAASGKDSSDEYVSALRTTFEKIFKIAREHLKNTVEVRKRRYDVGTSTLKLCAGQPVWLHDRTVKPGHCPKLTAPWKKGWVVTRVIDNITYKISKSADGPHRIVHIDRLLPYEGSNPPKWYSKQ